MEIRLSGELASILELVASGASNKEIGLKLNYSEKTVERRVSKLLRLYKVKNRTQLSGEYLFEKFENI